MRRRKKWLFVLLIGFAIIQFIQPAHNKSENVLPTDVTKVYPVPSNVLTILKTACYDCHSNNTRYPWYSSVQPGGWWLANHIASGKEELNFNEIGTYSIRRQINKLRSIENSIKDGTMPLSSYALLHKDARLTTQQKELIVAWVGRIKDSLEMVH